MRAMKRGFTLIETILVIAILGVMAISVGTLVVSHKRAYLHVASQKIKADIEHARGLAMATEGTTYGVNFDSAQNIYTVYAVTVATPVSDPQTRQPLIETFARLPGVQINNNYVVEFDVYGAPTTGGGGNVIISASGETRTITVLAGTGKVNIQ